LQTAKNDDIGLDWNYKYLEGAYSFTENGKYYLFYDPTDTKHDIEIK
jgi:hypothetical protein